MRAAWFSHASISALLNAVDAFSVLVQLLQLLGNNRQ